MRRLASRIVVPTILALVGWWTGMFLFGRFDGIAYLELDLHQWLQIQLAPAEPSPKILLIKGDASTPRKLDPETDSDRIPRRFQGQLLEKLKAAGARLVDLDFTFADRKEPVTARDQKNDAALRKALATSAPMGVALPYLSEAFDEQRLELTFYAPAILPDPVPTNIILGHAEGDLRDLVRSSPLRIQDRETGEWQLGKIVKIYLYLSGIPESDVQIDPDEATVRLGKETLQLDSDLSLYLRWPSQRGMFPEIPYDRALAELGDPSQTDFFRDKLVLVGDVREDIHETPLGPMPGVEINAILLSNLLDGSANRIQGLQEHHYRYWSLVLCIAMAFALGSRVSLASSSAILAVLLGGPVLGLLLWNRWLFTVQPLLAVAMTAVFVLVYQATRGRAFEPEALRSAAPRLDEATALFVDIAGSTDWVARVDAETSRRALGEALQAMSGEVQRAGGEIERTMGDGLLGIFRGIKGGHHSERAYRCAVAIQELLSDNNRAHPWEVRAGIESGPIAGGLLRTGQRTEWSSHGPVVHLASRLQALAGEQGYGLLMGPNTGRLLQEAGLAVRLLEETNVRGFAEPVRPYTAPLPAGTNSPGGKS